MDSPRRRAVGMETGGLPLVSTFALLTIVAGQLQGSGYSEEPEFLSPLENLTVAQGRDVHFTCTVNHLGGYKTSTGELPKNEEEEKECLKFASPLQNITVAAGKDVVFQCTLNIKPEFHKVAWIKSDTKTILAIHTHMVTINPRLSVTHNGHNTWKLYISNVEPKDSGTYMCQVNTDPMMSQMGHLSVVIPPDIADDTQSEHMIPEGGTVELHCSATGVPEPTISWRRTTGRNIVFRDDSGKVLKVVESYAGPVLTLKGLQRADMGTYLCIAANGIPPSMSRRYDISVQFEPVVRVLSPVVLRAADMQVTLMCYVEASPRSLNTWQRGRTQSADMQVTLMCYVEASPRSLNTWQRGRTQSAGGRDKLLNSSKYIVSEELINEYSVRMNLTITRLKKMDFGEYSCAAVNGYGIAEGAILLKEQQAPRHWLLSSQYYGLRSTGYGVAKSNG
ncbi:immunoglobulin domain-containing protein [Phthorimaea operculella]|nr:immunoglobulin domain-containing protein [Phthorimaea operculella]